MKKLLLALFLLSVCVVYAQNPLCFGQPSGYIQPTFGAYALGIVSFDFNGDGKKDLAVPDMTSNNVCVRLGTAGGTFGIPAYFSVGSSPQQIVAGDINSDGKSDLIVTNYSSNNISILYGTGTGSFSPAVNISIGTNPVNVLAADFNGDTKLDLAVCYSTNLLAILLGSGAGTFTISQMAVVGSSPRDAFSADFNNDGYADLAVANRQSNNVSVLLGSLTGTFAPSVNYIVGISPEAVASADFNSDGKADLVIPSFSSNYVSVLLGSGTGTFASALNYNVGTGPYGVELADFNSDGKPDLVVPNLNASSFSILYGSSTGTFAPALNFATPAGPYNLALDDFNGDGKVDVAATHGGAGTKVSLFFNGIPVPTITVNSGSVCAGQSFVMNPGGAFTYTITGGSTVVTPFVSTSYSVIGTNTTGCVSTVAAVSNITVYNLPLVQWNGGSICIGNSFTLMPTGAQTYTYSGGSAVVSPSITSSYSIIGTSAFGCISSNTAVASVTVNALPTFTVSGNNSVCQGSQLSQLAGGTALTYSWSNGATGNLVTLSPTVSTNYTITGTANNCSSSVTKFITVNPLPVIAVNSGSVCAGQSFTFLVSGASSYTYPVGSLPIVSPVANTVYTLSGIDVNGCIGTVLSTVAVMPLPLLVIDGGNATTCAGETVKLTANGAVTYSWSTGATSDSISTNPVSTTIYTVTGTDFNGCSNVTTFTQHVTDCLGITQSAVGNRQIVVYPNPTNGEFTLVTTEIGFVKIITGIGRVIFEKQLLEGKNKIDLSNYSNGIYFIQFKNNNYVKMIKE